MLSVNIGSFIILAALNPTIIKDLAKSTLAYIFHSAAYVNFI